MENKNNSGSQNSGNYNSGYRNSGNRNSLNRNSGNYNSGDYNSGNYNSGHYNSGDYNSGYRNSGDYNSGNYNSGDYNSGNHNSGFFNIDEPKVRIFGKETDIKRKDITFPSWFNFKLTEWIYERDMTEEQKNNVENSYYKTTGGILVKYEYKEAFRRSYEKATREEKLKVKELPNFDSDIFFEISGIRIDVEEKKKVTLELTDEQLDQIKDIIK